MNAWDEIQCEDYYADDIDPNDLESFEGYFEDYCTRHPYPPYSDTGE